MGKYKQYSEAKILEVLKEYNLALVVCRCVGSTILLSQHFINGVINIVI